MVVIGRLSTGPVAVMRIVYPCGLEIFQAKRPLPPREELFQISFGIKEEKSVDKLALATGTFSFFYPSESNSSMEFESYTGFSQSKKRTFFFIQS